MPWEDIRDFGGGQLPHERDWVVFRLEFGISYLRHVCGSPPPEFEIRWHEYELCDYPTISLSWEDPFLSLPWDYIEKCRRVLEILDEAISWSEINPNTVKEAFGEGKDFRSEIENDE
jgi:hypothetical protein